MSICLRSFEECIEKVTYGTKVQKSDYLQEGTFPIVSQEIELINGYWNKKEDIIEIERPVIIFGDHTRILKYVDFSFVLGADGAKIIKPKDFINSKFFFYFLQANQIESKGYARHYKFLKELKLDVPPLSIQQKIVTKLDAIFAEIEKAITLTQTNIENTEKLFRTYVDNIFLSNNDGYKELTLLDVTEIITCGVAKRPKYIDSGIPFLSARNVKNGTMKWDKFEFISKETHETLSKYNKPRIGDILYSRVGAGFGDAAIVDRDVEFSIFVSLTLIKTKPNLLNTYLRDYLNSSYVKKIAKANITGAGVGNLNVGAVRKFPIKLPPLDKQQKIINEIEKYKLLIDTMLLAYKDKLKQLMHLKHSFLQQAFKIEEVKR